MDRPTNREIDLTRQALRTPRAAAISGIVFSVLLTVSLVLIRIDLRESVGATNTTLSDPVKKSLLTALTLVPFAGIAFLWFIGVVRDRMGQHEDRFFASVFLGSGILFVAMLFSATAMAAGLITSLSSIGGDASTTFAWRIGREVTYTLLTTYAMRMAAVFTISTATIGLRLAILPRWVVLLGYGSALVLLLTVGYLPWVEEIFPAWVFLVSISILLATLRAPQGAAAVPAPIHNPARTSE